MSEIKKVVLAYSGGLDTSIIIPWLKEHYNNPEIIAVSGDVGQNDELEGLEEKAIKTGASKLYIADLTDEMVDEVIIPSMMMGAKYEDYLLGTAFARPVIAKRLVEIAKLKTSNLAEEGSIKKAYAELGRLYYAEHGNTPEGAYAAACERITVSRELIQANNDRIAELKSAAEAEGEVIVDADFQDVPEEAAPAEEAAPVEEAASAEETVPAEETKPEA